MHWYLHDPCRGNSQDTQWRICVIPVHKRTSLNLLAVCTEESNYGHCYKYNQIFTDTGVISQAKELKGFLECEHLQSASGSQWKTLVLPSHKISHWPFTTPSEKKSVISWVIFVIEHIISVKVFSFDQPSKSHIKHQYLLKGAVHRQSCSQGLEHSFNIWSDIDVTSVGRCLEMIFWF